MEFLKAGIRQPVRFISCGQFISEEPFIHARRVIDSFEVIAGIRGVLYIQQGDVRHEVKPGDIVLLLPGVTHFGYRASQGLSFYWVHFTFREKYTLLKGLSAQEGADAHSGTVRLPLSMRARDGGRLTILFRQLLHEGSFASGGWDMPDYLTTMLLIELTRQAVVRATVGAEDSRLALFIEWIRINLDTDITVRALANHFGFNQDYLTRWFKRKTGTTPLKYITRMRIEQAKQLLCESSRSVKEIARTLGFQDEKYFMKQFKAIENLTPSAYRNAFSKTHLNNR